MSVVKSKKIYNFQTYLSILTGICYFRKGGTNDLELIHDVLETEGLSGDYWDYPLDEIEHIIENDIPVVLVECLSWDYEKNCQVSELRWFQVPADFAEEN